jgi:putative transcriptional regulator
MDSLRGQLLIAAPALSDYFARSVVLVIEHTDEGALGIVLNRPTEATVTEVVEPLAELAGPEDVVLVGGPVSPDSVIALGEFEDRDEAARLVVGDLGLIDPDAPDPGLRGLRVYAGYAGWGPGQLESELDEEGWIVEPADREDLFSENADGLWSSVLRRKGGHFALVARMPVDPSVN